MNCHVHLVLWPVGWWADCLRGYVFGHSWWCFQRGKKWFAQSYCLCVTFFFGKNPIGNFDPHVAIILLPKIELGGRPTWTMFLLEKTSDDRLVCPITPLKAGLGTQKPSKPSVWIWKVVLPLIGWLPPNLVWEAFPVQKWSSCLFGIFSRPTRDQVPRQATYFWKMFFLPNETMTRSPSCVLEVSLAANWIQGPLGELWRLSLAWHGIRSLKHSLQTFLWHWGPVTNGKCGRASPYYTGVSQLQLRVSRYTVQLREGFGQN